MEVHPPRTDTPITPSQYPRIPTRTPIEILKEMSSLCIDGDIRGFQEVFESQLSTPDFEIRNFASVMVEAIGQDDTRFINELFRRGLNMSPLYASHAVKAKAKNALQTFLQHGWDINEPMNESTPPVLSTAIEDEDMATWLLDHGADPNRQCAIDLTPLSYAVKTAPISIIELMLNRGGDVRKGQLLHYAIDRQSDNIEVLKLLIRKGAAINATMYQDHCFSWRLYYFMGLGTVLHKASELGEVEIVRYLIEEGADPSITDANGRTAIECAHRLNQIEVVQELQKGK